jgi:U6 snRNA-associated Sm-like protein LSm6
MLYCRRAKASGSLTPGVLQSVDGFMNIALENTVELMNSRETNQYGDVFIRGNNGKQLVYKSSIDTN